MRFLLTIAAVLALVVPAFAQEDTSYEVESYAVFRAPSEVHITFTGNPDASPAPAAPAEGADKKRPSTISAPGATMTSIGGGTETVDGRESAPVAALYDRSVALSAVNYKSGAAAGSQVLTINFKGLVKADGCTITLNSAGTPTVPGVRFQHQLIDGSWSEWSPVVGGFNTAQSGNKNHAGGCGLDAAGQEIRALKVSPPANFAGAIWYREFRLSYLGVSAE